MSEQPPTNCVRCESVDLRPRLLLVGVVCLLRAAGESSVPENLVGVRHLFGGGVPPPDWCPKRVQEVKS